ncbi:MAG: bifunctional 3,4-dihydroxy-2-butanone-4-phosphate synthase/GTP cyclohydrolase II, partial [Candidatus Omnitrophica bacterium]|nr:bifunctional 3,4-dihydroxy-2-butanone-4-phosphate synthase/GTP cyclohydrolase II [Candidatus Omnitrophota bacterium]
SLKDVGTLPRLANHEVVVAGNEGYGIKIVKRVPIVVEYTSHCKGYIETKKRKLGHII